LLRATQPLFEPRFVVRKAILPPHKEPALGEVAGRDRLAQQPDANIPVTRHRQQSFTRFERPAHPLGQTVDPSPDDWVDHMIAQVVQCREGGAAVRFLRHRGHARDRPTVNEAVTLWRLEVLELMPLTSDAVRCEVAENSLNLLSDLSGNDDDAWSRVEPSRELLVRGKHGFRLLDFVAR
jgi:hypothetical protein